MLKALVTFFFPRGKERKLKKIRNFFRPYPYWRPLVTNFGAAAIIWYLYDELDVIIFWIGLGLIGVGAFLVISYAYQTATSKEMKAWLEDTCHELKDTSMQKMKVEQSEIIGAPVCICAPVFWKYKKLSDKLFPIQVNRQKECFFGMYHIVWVILTKEFMDIYQYHYSFLLDKVIDEQTAEYFYRNIVSITIKEHEIHKRLPKNKWFGTADTYYLKNAEMFTLTVDTGNPVEIILRAKAVDRKMRAKIDTTANIDTIEKIRTILRERKAELSRQPEVNSHD